MIRHPNAKINLGLHITEKRPDGFHNLESIFYPIGLSDILEIVTTPNKETANSLQFSSSGIPIPGKGNLCEKAYVLLKTAFPDQMKGVSCLAHLHKLVPIGAGLGGGSSDAAFSLRMLNHLFNLRLDDSQLENYAGQIGSDCPFFIRNKPVFAGGRGELFEPITLHLSNYYIKLVIPQIHVSTPWAYSQIIPKKSTFDLRTIGTLPIKEWKNTLVNDFETAVFLKHPEIALLKEELYREGAVYASMSGSGSAVFGLFTTPQPSQAEKADCTVWTGRLS